MTSLALTVALLTAGLPTGAQAPDISARNQDGKLIRLSDLKGKPVLIYFYPKDDSPGCTKEACELRDSYAAFQKAGAVILGVSTQDAASHRAFRAKYHLPFDLLVDEDGAVAKAFGVASVPVIGYHQRQSVLLDAQGKVVKFFDKVDPATHSTEVLKLLGAPAAPAKAEASHPAHG
jgi:peroxiredoxin Q/BCP